MERFTQVETFNGDLFQRPIFEGNEPALTNYTSFPPKSHPRPVSFSSWIRPGTPKPVAEQRLGRRIDNTEICIFDAKRYFNEGQNQKNRKTSTVTVNLDRISERCDLSAISRLSSVSSVDGYGRNYRSGSFDATPTAVISEASWNSHSGLLSNPPPASDSVAISIRNLPLYGKRRSFTQWLFGRQCPCSGKKSVQVEDKFSDPKTPVHSNCKSKSCSNPGKHNSKKCREATATDKALKEKAKEFDEYNLDINERTTGRWAYKQEVVSESGRISQENHLSSEIGRQVVPSSGRSFMEGGGFSFPIVIPLAEKLTRGKTSRRLEDSPRKSLEVFRLTDESVVRKTTQLQRHLEMSSFTGDSDRQVFIFPSSPKTQTSTKTDDDVGSETSSDLFEIESFSTQATSNVNPTYFRRDSLNEISTTAASYFDEDAIISIVQQESEKRGSIGGEKRKGNGLLSCRGEKAVNVVPNLVKYPVKCVTERQLPRIAPPATSRLAYLNSMHMARVPSMPPIGKSHSTRTSPAFRTYQARV